MNTRRIYGDYPRPTNTYEKLIIILYRYRYVKILDRTLYCKLGLCPNRQFIITIFCFYVWSPPGHPETIWLWHIPNWRLRLGKKLLSLEAPICGPEWSGMCSAADCARLDSLLRRAKRFGYWSDDVPAMADLFNSTVDDFSHPVKTL